MIAHRTIVLGGGAIGITAFLVWEYKQRQASDAVNAAITAENSASEYAIMGQSVENTTVPAGGLLPSNPITEAPEGFSPASVLTPSMQIPVIAPTGGQV